MARTKISQARAKALLDIVERVSVRACEVDPRTGTATGLLCECLPCQARKLLDGENDNDTR